MIKFIVHKIIIDFRSTFLKENNKHTPSYQLELIAATFGGVDGSNYIIAKNFNYKLG